MKQWLLPTKSNDRNKLGYFDPLASNVDQNPAEVTAFPRPNA
jgi:hypothetical protein